MKIIGQDSDGRLILDLEYEGFNLHSAIPYGSPVVLKNGLFSNSDAIPNGSVHGVWITQPDESGQFQNLEMIDPYEEVEEVDPIKNRWEILDL